MADDADLLSRADALIKPEAGAPFSEQQEPRQRLPRRRSFIASATGMAAQDRQQRLFAPDNDDDLPVLTDVVLPPATTAADEIADAAAGLRAALADELAENLHRRISEELPELVAGILVRASAELRVSLQAALAETVSDYLAQRGQLRLPLAVPASDDPHREDEGLEGLAL